MRKILATRQFLRLAALRVTFLKKKTVFRHGLGECVYQISGMYRFSFDQEAFKKPTNQHIYKWIKEFWKIMAIEEICENSYKHVFYCQNFIFWSQILKVGALGGHKNRRVGRHFWKKALSGGRGWTLWEVPSRPTKINPEARGSTSIIKKISRKLKIA